MNRRPTSRGVELKSRFLLQGRTLRLLLLVFVFYLLFVSLLASTLFPASRGLAMGDVAGEDVIAPRTVVYIDPEKTKALQDLAEQSVMPVYNKDFTTARQDLVRTQINNYINIIEQIAGNATLPAEEKRTRLQQALPASFDPSAIESALKLNPKIYTTLLSYTMDIALQFLERGIKEDDLPSLPVRIHEKVIVLGLSPDDKIVIESICRAVLSPNLTLDVEETERRKEIARSAVDPVRRQISKGEVVLKKDMAVTAENLPALEALGITRQQFPWQQLVGTVLIALALFVVWVALSFFFARGFLTERRLLFVGILFALVILAGRFLPARFTYLTPVPLASMAFSTLFNLPFSLVFTACASLGVGLIQGNDFLVAFALFLGGAVGAYAVRQVLRTSDFLRAGLMAGLVLAFTVGAVGLISGMGVMTAEAAGWAFANGILSSVFAVFLLLVPLTESIFDLTSPLHLIELANPNHPLLKRLLLEAPGTYQHSVMVASLAESAASAISANMVMVRAAAYFHDIGKVVRPGYFAENQLGGENAHERLSPQLSSQVVMAHTKDGAEIARSANVPEPVVRLILSHHGTSVTKYFYQMAVFKEEELGEEGFRYSGPLPESKEGGILMLADGVEAAVRSLKEKTAERIAKTVENLFEDRVEDGQLAKSELSFRELEKIEEVFVRILTSTYHPRPEYPAKEEKENGHLREPPTSRTEGRQKTTD
jgi:putative nucleotidyltransferase with HDIG domain